MSFFPSLNVRFDAAGATKAQVVGRSRTYWHDTNLSVMHPCKLANTALNTRASTMPKDDALSEFSAFLLSNKILNVIDILEIWDVD